MDSCTWTTLNVKKNLLKTKKNKQNNKERCLYIYFSLGNNNLLNLIEKSLSAPYPYICYSLMHFVVNPNIKN